MQWLPYKWQYQLFYLLYRWALAIYFSGWLIGLGTQLTSFFFIFLTDWSLLLFTTYLVYAAVCVTFDYFETFVFCRNKHFEVNSDERYTKGVGEERHSSAITRPHGCLGSTHNQLKWYDMLHWVLFTLGTEAAVSVVVLFWTALYRGGPVNPYDGNIHLGNGIAALIDVWVTGIPVRILHFFYIQIYGTIYSLFSVIYYLAGGLDPWGHPYIYPVLDYSANPGGAAGLLVGAFLCVPLVHMLFYVQYITRRWLVYLLCHRRQPLDTDPLA